jgi:hypothetical protein
MSWNDYYRFRFSLLNHKPEHSELPGLRGWISGWGILFVVAVGPLSGLTGLRTNLTVGFAAAVPLVGILWLIAALGEDFPRTACWSLLVLCAGVLGLTLYVAPDVLARSWSYKRDFAMLTLFAAYPILVAASAVRQLRRLAHSSAV